MTARELIKALQDLGEENLDKEVRIYDEYSYTDYADVDTVEIMKERDVYDEKQEFIGIN